MHVRDVLVRDLGFHLLDCLFAGAIDFVRVRQPAIIRFAVDPSLDEIDEASGLQLRFDSAYWINAIRARDETAPVLVEAFSFALPSFDDSVARVDRIIDNTDDGADLCGPNPSIRTGDEWRERAVEIQRGDTPRPARNEIDATLENVASLTIDLSGAGIDVASPADVTVSSDGPCTVALRGLRPGQLVASGDAENRADDDGVAAVEIESAGTVEMRLRE